MLTSEDYRKRAQVCIELAQGAREPDRARLLELAKTWLNLADQAADCPNGQPVTKRSSE